MIKNHLSTGMTYPVDPLEFHIPFWKRVLFYTNAVAFAPYALILMTLNKSTTFWPNRAQSDIGPMEGISCAYSKPMDFGVVRQLQKKLNKATIATIVENAFVSAAKQILPANRIPAQFTIAEIVAMLPYPSAEPHNRFSYFFYNINPDQPDFERIQSSKQASWRGMTGPWIPLAFCILKFVGKLPVFMHGMLLRGGSCSVLFSNVPVSKTRCQILGNEVLGVTGIINLSTSGFVGLTSAMMENSLQFSATVQPTLLTREELEQILEAMPKVLVGWLDSLKQDLDENP